MHNIDQSDLIEIRALLSDRPFDDESAEVSQNAESGDACDAVLIRDYFFIPWWDRRNVDEVLEGGDSPVSSAQITAAASRAMSAACLMTCCKR